MPATKGAKRRQRRATRLERGEKWAAACGVKEKREAAAQQSLTYEHYQERVEMLNSGLTTTEHSRYNDDDLR